MLKQVLETAPGSTDDAHTTATVFLRCKAPCFVNWLFFVGRAVYFKRPRLVIAEV